MELCVCHYVYMYKISSSLKIYSIGLWGLLIAVQLPVDLTISCNMKQALPRILANLKIICRFHAHPVHQNNVDIFGPRYVGDDFYKVETSPVQSSSRSLRDLKS